MRQFKTMADSKSKITIDHDEIKSWTEARQGMPVKVKKTGGKNDPGLLRINFPGGKEENLEEISWVDFFDKFEENDLAFLYQEETAYGQQSRFFKFINRKNMDNKMNEKNKNNGREEYEDEENMEEEDEDDDYEDDDDENDEDDNEDDDDLEDIKEMTDLDENSQNRKDKNKKIKKTTDKGNKR